MNSERALRYVDELEAHMDEDGLTGPNNVRGLIQMVRELCNRRETMSMEKIARDMRIGVFPKKSEQKVQGIGRMADNNRALLIIMAVEPTDDEIRSLHDYLGEWQDRS